MVVHVLDDVVVRRVDVVVEIRLYLLELPVIRCILSNDHLQCVRDDQAPRSILERQSPEDFSWLWCGARKALEHGWRMSNQPVVVKLREMNAKSSKVPGHVVAVRGQIDALVSERGEGNGNIPATLLRPWVNL